MQDLRIPSEYEGQLSLFDDCLEQGANSSLIAVSKIFASAKKQMNLPEWKAFALALTHIKWNEDSKEKNVVTLDKKEVAEKIGLKSDEDHLSQDLKRAIGKLPNHSFLEFESGNGWSNGNFITLISCSQKNIVKIKFEEAYLPLFQELNKTKNYITMWAEDLFSMNSERSIIFYEELRLHSDTSKENSKIYGIKELKEMFNIPKEGKGSYLRKDKHFDRTAFEKRIIDPLCEEMKKCSMVNLTASEDGKLYTKIKSKSGKVLGYEFQWIISDHPKVATAAEVKTLNQNPQDLKIAKDLKKGRATKKKSQNTFNNFKQNQYTSEEMAELEKLLVEN